MKIDKLVSQLNEAVKKRQDVFATKHSRVGDADYPIKGVNREMYKDYIGRAMVRETMIREFQPVDSKSYFVEDKNLWINYSPTITDAGVSVQFKNKRDKVIKIIWDESVFMSPGGSSEGIFHAGVTIADRSAPKPATVIPPR